MSGAFPETPAPSSPSSLIAASNEPPEMPPAVAPASPPAPTSEQVGERAKPRKGRKKKKKQQQQQQQEQQQQQQAAEAETSTPVPATAAAPAPDARFDPLAPAFVPAFAAPSAPASASATTTADQPAKDPFDFVRPILALKCRLQGCEKQTLDDGESVAYPACGVASLVRYCCKQHLYDDVRPHFLLFCGRFPVHGPVDESAVARVQASQPRPYLRDAPGAALGTIEHHRQAVHFAMEDNNSGDYFLFADSAALASIANPSEQQIQNCRGTGELVAKIKMPENEDVHDHRKHRFRLLVTRCLTFGTTTEQGRKDCIDLAAMIRQELIERDEWNDDMITHLAMGMKQEFDFQLPESMMQ